MTLEATSVEPFDCNWNWITTLSIRLRNGSFIDTPETPFSKLEHPIEAVGGISQFLQSEDSKAVLFLSVQVLHALGRRHGAGGVCGAVHGGGFLLVQFRGGFALLLKEETLHFATMKSSCNNNKVERNSEGKAINWIENKREMIKLMTQMRKMGP